MRVDECVVLFYIFEAILLLGFVLYCINVVGGSAVGVLVCLEVVMWVLHPSLYSHHYYRTSYDFASPVNCKSKKKMIDPLTFLQRLRKGRSRENEKLGQSPQKGAL